MGEEKIIKAIHRDLQFPGDHIIIPISLTVKRYFQIPATEIDILHCTYWNCPLHFGDLKVFPEALPKWLIVGKTHQ